MSPDFLQFNEYGLYCLAGDFYLDPSKPVKNAVISHAHADHAVAGNTNVWCTPETAAIMRHRYKKNAGANFNERNYGDEFMINGVRIRFLSAGHMLGSAQVLMTYQGTKYLYTGDLKLQADKTCVPVEWETADVLITETTFAHPEVKHPDVTSEIGKLREIKYNILLGAYALGKSQRLINLINEHVPEKKILVHHSILPINKIYESFNFHPGVYQPYDRKLMKAANEGYIYIVPPLTFNSYFRAVNVLRIFASGWKSLQQRNDAELFISDHVDWDDILDTVETVRPTEIWTLHGNGNFLREHYANSLQVKILN
ncbi:MBL fold metallo-hydrolase [Pedobacter sp. HMF7647]|uniref:MBL fold metallo-hydrolase n=1 Tax=Hufsiella arboris TaxID=2695275 RepID=A0A7K1YDR3_9SPHI|nr:MBL fold metallo-hydrolase [Hufsiella arboris]MXV52501.1 MBL fold metallo-hydrolase [Hufsiella arboris]